MTERRALWGLALVFAVALAWAEPASAQSGGDEPSLDMRLRGWYLRQTPDATTDPVVPTQAERYQEQMRQQRSRQTPASPSRGGAPGYIGPLSTETSTGQMGASGWTILWRVTIPNVRWALLYGVILCNARAMGEFGAVSVVSGHVRGLTNTLPLQVEVLYNEYQVTAAFALASLMTGLALVTLVVQAIIERRLLR